MKYEDIIAGSRKMKAPGIEAEGRVAMNGKEPGTMIDILKEIDRKTRFSIRALQAVYVFMILIATGYLILSDNGLVQLGIGCLILAFVIVLDFFSAYLVWLKRHKPVVTEIDGMLGEIDDCLTPDM